MFLLAVGYQLSKVHPRYSINEIVNRVKILYQHAKGARFVRLPDYNNHDFLTHFVVGKKTFSLNINKNLHIPVYMNVRKCQHNFTNIITRIVKLPTLKLFYNKSHSQASLIFRYLKLEEKLLCNFYRK